jgi:DNA primase
MPHAPERSGDLGRPNRYHRAVRFDDRFLDEIKSRLRLSDVIGRTVKLRRQGREYVGLSPFAKERTPSFFVNDDKGFFHDFSSGKHGDLIGFLQETERLTFVEAVERLAGMAGVPLPAPDPESAARDRRREGLGDWLETAATWFEGELRRPAGQAARDYLIRRGLAESEWSRFRLGFAPAGRTALKDYLVTKGVPAADLLETGLVIAPEDGGATYDRFRARIIFPITDGRGRTISFGGRAMDPQARAKYLNGPDTSLFDKGRVLYGLPEARKLLHTSADAALVVVEGYMDVIACQRAGVAAVAAMGTALTETQMEMLWRLHPEPTLCFDGDRAGMQAASRAIDRALPLLKAGRSFKFAVVSGGKDPDDVLREQGAGALKASLADTTAFAEALFKRESEAQPLDTPERRAGLKQRLRAAARAITDPDLAGAYGEALMARYTALFASAPREERPFRRDGGRWRPDGKAFIAPLTPEGRAGGRSLATAMEPAAAALARRAIRDPPVLDPHLEVLQSRGFGDPALMELAREIIRLRIEADVLDSEALQRHLAGRGYSALLIDIDRAATHAGAPFENDDVTLAAARSQWSHAFEVMNRMAALEEALTAAKQSLAVDASGLPTFMALKAERDLLRRAVKTGQIWNADEASQGGASR